MAGLAYAPVIGWGTAELAEDEQEKIRGLKLPMKNQTGRDFEMNGAMASPAAVIRIRIERFTAKARPRQGRLQDELYIFGKLKKSIITDKQRASGK